MPHYDVIIIGSGAGGATMAQSLAPSGKSILILERGEHLPIEADNWNAKAVFVDKKYRAREHWLDKNGRAFMPNTNYWVGGNTSFYGGALMRFKREDFGAVIHAGGFSPAWPITYNDMKPWYEAAERVWEVHGTRGIDPTDQDDDPPFPFPALTHDPGVERLRLHFEAIGWTPSPLPLAIRRNDSDPALGICIRCMTCGGFPCQILAKVDARTAALAPLRDAANVTLLAGYKVLKLETDDSGRKIVAAFTQGPNGPEIFTADLFVLAAGAANSAALLLASHSDQHPRGLANRSDQVGRNYMFHATSAIISISITEFEAPFPKTLCVNDFYLGDPNGDFPYPMGQIQMLEYMSGQTLEGQLADIVPPDFIPNELTDEIASHMVSFLAMSEDLPDPDNRVTLAPDGTIVLSYTFGDLTAHQRLVDKLEAGLYGFVRRHHTLFEPHFEVDELLPLYGTAHQCGTLRMGNDPATSVVDANCKAHDLDNLYVTDSSVFVSSAAVNPTLTIVANAMRVGAHVLATQSSQVV
jgi:choline dehydrogenase-like flavoprotein